MKEFYIVKLDKKKLKDKLNQEAGLKYTFNHVAKKF